MGEKIRKTYEALREGAGLGLSETALYRFVREKHPKATGKRIVKAAPLALSDPDMKSEAALQAIFALAIRLRLNPDANAAEEPPPSFSNVPEEDAAPDHSDVLDPTADA